MKKTALLLALQHPSDSFERAFIQGAVIPLLQGHSPGLTDVLLEEAGQLRGQVRIAGRHVYFVIDSEGVNTDAELAMRSRERREARCAGERSRAPGKQTDDRELA